MSPQSGSGPVHFNSCTFMEDHKKGPSLTRGAAAGGEANLGLRVWRSKPLSLVPYKPLGLTSLPYR